MDMTASASPVDLPPGAQLLTSVTVREHCGGVCDMTLWRWQRSHGFPLPFMQVGNRNYWRLDDVLAWIEKRHTETNQRRKDAA